MMPPLEATRAQHTPAESERGAAPPSPGGGPGAGGRSFMTSFLEHLVRNKIITEDVALRAAEWKNHAEGQRRTPIEILEQEFGLSRDVLHYQVALFYAFRVIDIKDRSIRRLRLSDVHKIFRALPESVRQLAMRHKVLPYDIAENQPDKIILVTPNPTDREIHQVARALPHKKFEICFMKERDWSEYWRQLSSDNRQSPVPETVIEEEETDLESIVDKDINRGQLTALVDNLFDDAVRVGATDIQIVPRSYRKTDIYFRIDGRRSLWYSIEDARAEAVVAVMKTRVLNLDRFERMTAQEGAAQKIVDNATVRFRVSVLPIISREHGAKFESVSIHMRKEGDAPGRLDEIGFSAGAGRLLGDAAAAMKGLVIVAGPSGSGKTTTLLAALESVMRPTYNTIIVESGVEYFVEGAIQVKLNQKLGMADALESISHHDPDIVLLGELRDKFTADIALTLANNGKLVLSTIRGASAAGTLVRLVGWGLEPFLVAEAVSLVVGQRLVRKLCDRCKEPVAPPARDMLERMGLSGDILEAIKFFRPNGCIHCIGGFKGRLPIQEALPMTREVREVMYRGGAALEKKALEEVAAGLGMQTLRESGIELLKSGLTTVAEIVQGTHELWGNAGKK